MICRDRCGDKSQMNESGVRGELDGWTGGRADAYRWMNIDEQIDVDTCSKYVYVPVLNFNNY